MIYIFRLGGSWHPRNTHSRKLRVDWAIPQTLCETFSRDDAERIVADVTESVERLACCSLVPVYKTILTDVTYEQSDEHTVGGWSNKIRGSSW